ncbi:MAG: transglutaminase domain-containing protein [Desulfobacterales bacterium]
MKRLPLLTFSLGLIFIALMGIRQVKYGGWGWAAPNFSAPATRALAERETWMNIIQNGTKIGYAHSFRRQAESGYTIGEEMVMRLTALGTLQEVRMTTRAGLAADYSLKDFDFNLASGAFRFQSAGQVSGRNLLVEIKTPESERALSIPLSTKPHLPAGILDAAIAADLPVGESLSLPLFDPATLGSAPVTITHTGADTLRIEGHSYPTHHYTIEFKGGVQQAWMDDQGNVRRQEGLLGLVLEQTTREAALQMDTAATAGDIVAAVSIPVAGSLPDPRRLERLTLRISGLEAPEKTLDGGRQQFADGQLIVIKETLPPEAAQQRRVSGAAVQSQFLKSTPFIQADHPRIKAIVAQITAKHDPLLSKARKIMAWMAEHIDQRPVLALPNALSVLEQKVGDCNEHAVLLAALCRAAGIPAQVEAGLVYQKGRFYYHAWNSLYLGSWITADAVFQQLPADVTHIRLAQGDQDLYFDMLGIVGKVGIEIVSAQEEGLERTAAD